MRRSVVVALVALIVALSAAVSSGSAANEKASCKGVLVSSAAGEAGLIADLTREINQIAKDAGFPPGVVVSSAAGHLHEGSLLACLRALGF